MLRFILLYFYSKSICLVFKKLKASAFVSESSRKWGVGGIDCSQKPILGQRKKPIGGVGDCPKERQ